MAHEQFFINEDCLSIMQEEVCECHNKRQNWYDHNSESVNKSYIFYDMDPIGQLPGIVEDDSRESSWQEPSNRIEMNVSGEEQDKDGYKTFSESNSIIENERDLEPKLTQMYTQRFQAPFNLLRTIKGDKAARAMMVQISDIDIEISVASSVEQEKKV